MSQALQRKAVSVEEHETASGGVKGAMAQKDREDSEAGRNNRDRS